MVIALPGRIEVLVPFALQVGRQLGARVREHVEMGDHHDWTAAEVKALAKKATALGVKSVVTTAKDAVKLDAAWDGAGVVAVLEEEVEPESGEALAEFVCARLA